MNNSQLVTSRILKDIINENVASGKIQLDEVILDLKKLDKIASSKKVRDYLYNWHIDIDERLRIIEMAFEMNDFLRNFTTTLINLRLFQCISGLISTIETDYRRISVIKINIANDKMLNDIENIKLEIINKFNLDANQKYNYNIHVVPELIKGYDAFVGSKFYNNSLDLKLINYFSNQVDTEMIESVIMETREEEIAKKQEEDSKKETGEN